MSSEEDAGDAAEDQDRQDWQAEDGDGTPDVAIFDRVRSLVAGEGELDLGDVAERAGLPREVLREIFEAVSWDDRPGYDDRDVDYAQAVARILDHYPFDTVVRTMRTRYRALSSIVVSDLGAVRDHVVTPALAEGAQPEELAVRLGETAERIFPLVTTQLAEDYRHVLVRLLESEALASGIRLEGAGHVELAVGFVDVSGYTALSARVDPSGLDRVLRSFEDRVTRAVAEAEDVLLAKFIGDAAMVVGPDPLHVADLLLSLVEETDPEVEAPRRAGLSFGDVLVREGDYYGRVPNLAARLTDHARQWSLLADEDLHDRFEDHFELTRIPERTLHGIGERQPIRVRRKEA